MMYAVLTSELTRTMQGDRDTISSVEEPGKSAIYAATIDEARRIADEFAGSGECSVTSARRGIGEVSYVGADVFEFVPDDEHGDEFGDVCYSADSLTEEVEAAWNKAVSNYRRFLDHEQAGYFTVAQCLEGGYFVDGPDGTAYV